MAPISWPLTNRPTGIGKPFLVVCRSLQNALRRESKAAIAYAWGVSMSTVVRWKRALGIPGMTPGSKRARCTAKAREWTEVDNALLGTVPDLEIAARLACHVETVRNRRRWLGIPAFRAFRWTAAKDALLGTMHDHELLPSSAVPRRWYGSAGTGLGARYSA